MNGLDERIRAALHAAANGVQEQDLRPAQPPRTPVRTRQPVRWIAPLLAGAAVIAVALTTFALTTTGNSAHQSPPQPGGSSPAPVPSPTSSGPGYNCYFDFGPKYACSTPAGYVGYEPLWPFADYSEAHQWQTVDQPNGHSPWHSDAEATALFFASGFLHFNDITMMTSSQVSANEALIGVGYKLPSGLKHTAAVLRLVRFSPVAGDQTAGWEVVGTVDTDFSITVPEYGATVTSPMTVGGRITGTDESITIAVRTSDGHVDKISPIPAGGQDAPWSATVLFSGHGVLAVIASTGGHLTAHERFAVTGVVSPTS
jgi:hypothetical protein